MDPIILYALVAVIFIAVAAAVLGGGSEASQKDAQAAPSSFPYRQAGTLKPGRVSSDSITSEEM